MTKRVVFAGGAQVKALAKAYRLDIALDTDEDVFFIGAESLAREAAQKVVAAADILITDLTADGPTVADELIRVGTLRIAVPVVTADFIWPYAEGGHPRNAPATGLPDGPYPSGFGDSYLDRLAQEGMDEDEAINRYLALDVAQDGQIEEKRAETMGRLRKLDALTGFDLAEFIEANFRTQWLFATRDRPNLPLFRHIAARLFGHMGIAASRIAQLSDTFLPPGAMPIHPGVLAHFGMQTPSATYRYPVLDEGYFSFEQYCRRYWNYDFNRLLHSAIAKAAVKPSEAIPELRLALETSPESRAGLRALRDAERSVSDLSLLSPLALAAPAAPAAVAAPAEPQPPAAPKPARETQAAPAAPPALESDTPPDLAEATGHTDPGTPAEPVSLPPLRFPSAGATPPAEAPAAPEPAQTAPRPSGSLVLRSAFGSALVRAPASSRPPVPLDEDEAESGDAPAPSLRFSGFPLPDAESPRESAGELVPLTDFGAMPQHMTPLVLLPPDDAPDPEPQPYIELGQMAEPAMLLPGKSASGRGNAYTPLAPSDHLIPLLPRMLPSTRVMSSNTEIPFFDMPETMPPPPLRPVLPPELHPEPVKTSLMAKLMDQLRK